MRERHALRRTSPKGRGEKFLGTCVKCGKENISLHAQKRQTCPNPGNLDFGEVLGAIIKGEV